MADMTREELQIRIAEALAQDPQFRDRLVSDPRAVVSELTGLSMPEAVKVTVHQESLSDIHLVIPASSSALSEEDLELVAGGAAWGNPCQACGCAG